MLPYMPTKSAYAESVTEDELDDTDIFGETAEDRARLEKADMDYDLYIEDKLFLRR